MSWTAEARELVMRRYPLVCVVTLVGVTALLQAHRVAEFGALAEELASYKSQSKVANESRPSMPEIAKWTRAVPNATLTESSQFLVVLDQLAMDSKCDIGNTGDSPVKAVEGADALDAIESSVEVQGTYDGLVRFLTLLRENERALAVTRASISATEYPRLRANLTLRRYVRHTGAVTRASSSGAAQSAGS